MNLAPAIVLVQTQMSENIGAAARAMKNFGLSELRLVAPLEGWPHPRAYDLAGHAADILDAATHYPTVQEAVTPFQRLYASTARPREMIKPVLAPMQAVTEMSDARTAILFGPERTGLTNEDIALCDAIITIPTAPGLASLNIAQSVVVVAYQWFIHHHVTFVSAPLIRGTTSEEASPVGEKSPHASKQQLQQFFDHLERSLDAVDFWKVAEKKPKMWINLRNIFSRANLTDQEVRTLHGVIAELSASKPSR